LGLSTPTRNLDADPRRRSPGLKNPSRDYGGNPTSTNHSIIMNPILVSAVGEVAARLVGHFLANRGTGAAGAGLGKAASPPTNLTEAHAQFQRYAEERARIDAEQSEVIVKIAEKVDALALEQQRFQQRMETFMTNTRRAQTITLLGALCGVGALFVAIFT